jgi:hypothetical protein
LSTIETLLPETAEDPPIRSVDVFGSLTTAYVPFGAKLISHVPFSTPVLPAIFVSKTPFSGEVFADATPAQTSAQTHVRRSQRRTIGVLHTAGMPDVRTAGE